MKDLGRFGNGLENVYISTHDDYVDGETYASLTVRDGFVNQAVCGPGGCRCFPR